MDKRLSFFDKDEIVWAEHPMRDLYARLIRLRRDTRALWSGKHGAPMVPVPTTADDRVLAFVRQDDDTKVFAAFNLSPEPVSVAFRESPAPGHYRDFFAPDGSDGSDGSDEQTVEIVEGEPVELGPWDYRLLLG